jgi:hypothetical protein
MTVHIYGFDNASRLVGWTRNVLLVRWILLLAVCLGLVGCAGSPSADDLSISSHSAGDLAIVEYALVEQSVDNPDHAAFTERARQAVLMQRGGLGASRHCDRLAEDNVILAPYGLRIELNPTPPFSAYALYQGDRLIHRDITHFSETILYANDFALPFETIHGDRLVADTLGLRRISTASSARKVSAALVDGGGLAYAALPVSASVAYAGSAPAEAQAAFGSQTLSGQPLQFVANSDSGSQVRLHYAGSDLPYVYDSVIHGQTGETAVFNPGSSGSIAWFYALRDGLWYYVEIDSRGE